LTSRTWPIVAALTVGFHHNAVGQKPGFIDVAGNRDNGIGEIRE
jgi:hypothetical protein